MQHVTYNELVEQSGQKMAYALLRIVERQVNIDVKDVEHLDRNARMQHALEIMHGEAVAA